MVLQRATDVAAGAAATSWFWLPSMHEGLQIVLAVLGIVWLLVQIVHKVRHWNDKK